MGVIKTVEGCMHKAGAKEVFSFKMLWLLLITFVLSKAFKYSVDFLCEIYPEQCFWIEKIISIFFGVSFVFLVLKPFAKLFKLENKSKGFGENSL
jgi:hypothetical protein